MDSVTQFVLGASIAEILVGRSVGYKAALWGGLAATLPDIDVLVHQNQDEITRIVLHRSWSHSIILLSIIAIPVAWMTQKFHKISQTIIKRWYLMIWLAMITHPLLDSLTVYGTQLLWPITNNAFAFNTIFIIDPLYTIPIIIGLVCARIFYNTNKGFIINSIAFSFSLLYLLWGSISNQIATQHIKKNLISKNINTENLLITPTPFNTFLWRFITFDDKYYHEGLYSLFDKREEVFFTTNEHNQNLLKTVENSPSIDKLKWFSQGNYKISIENIPGKDKKFMILDDLRFGYAGSTFFRFVIAEKKKDKFEPVLGYKLSINIKDSLLNSLEDLLQRILNEDKTPSQFKK